MVAGGFRRRRFYDHFMDEFCQIRVNFAGKKWLLDKSIHFNTIEIPQKNQLMESLGKNLNRINPGIYSSIRSPGCGKNFGRGTSHFGPNLCRNWTAFCPLIKEKKRQIWTTRRKFIKNSNLRHHKKRK